MDLNAIPETTDRRARGRAEGRHDGRNDRAAGWGPGRVWLAWGIYFTVLAVVALAALMGT